MLGFLEDVLTPFPPLKDPEVEYTDPFRLGPIENIEVLAESVESSDLGHDESHVDQDEDIWRIGDLVEPKGNEIIHRCWDNFGDNAGEEEPCSAYISEGRPQVFDAALRLQRRKTLSKDASSNIVQSKLLTTVCY